MASEVHPIWLAQSRLKRRRFDDCIDGCTAVLSNNPYDQAAWYLKCRALTLKHWLDDTEIEEEGAGDALLDEHHVAQAARPGTSLARPATGSASGPSQVVRPMTGSGRPVTGFLRPGTGSNRPGTGSNKPGTRGSTASVQQAVRGAKPGTSRPLTTSGRFARLGTASMLVTEGGPFIQADRLDMAKYAARPLLARVLCDYMLYVDHNMRKALELAGHAVKEAGADDWWWQERLGKAYYQLGLLREAEKQFAAALQSQDMSCLVLQLCKVHLRLDQPTAALEAYGAAAERHPGDTALLLGSARVHEALEQSTEALALYQQVLTLDAGNVEAIACLAAHHFYSDQPELATRYYRRLLQMGVANAEIWTNLGLCCFYASQYDMCLGCFDRALQLADDDVLPDLWYNIGQVAVGIGDLGWAHQCFKLAASLDPHHSEALNNLGVLELRRGNEQQAASCFRTGQRAGNHAYELHYNLALLAYRQGDLQLAWAQVNDALAIFPQHTESLEMKRLLQDQLMSR